MAVTISPTEAAHTLAEPAPRVLGVLDQAGLWANLGVSLLGPVGAVYVLAPPGFRQLSFVGALLAVAVGTVLGTALVAVAAIPGAQTGAPSMVLLRGVFGGRISYLPTLVNVVQLVGWTVFEIVVITEAAQQLLPWHHVRWPYVVVAGVLTTVMALRPLGAVRVLRRYALVAVLAATIYLFVELSRHPMPSVTTGSWSGFWHATDYTIAVSVSWAPLASDYSRHSRSVRGAFASCLVGYSIAQIAYYALGLVALATVVRSGSASLQHDMFATFIAVPLGWLAFGVLLLRELDQSFADTYSTVVSLQNVGPRVDRRLLALVLGAVATALALALPIEDYQNFLLVLGAVLVPLMGVFVVDYFLLRRGRSWDVSPRAPARWAMLVPWALGVVTYQLINPIAGGAWQHAWTTVGDWLHFTPASWMSASIGAFLVAAAVSVLVAPFTVRTR